MMADPGDPSPTLEDAPQPLAAAATTRGELQQRALQGSMWTALHSITAAPIAFVANALVARALGPVDYGRLALLTLVVGLVLQVSDLGVTGGMVQWGAAAQA